ncbi:MAG TPA: hypothetical protein VKU02_33455 [Gemmataceae bacterium]|nr:hypothetical protein [Gemmataceae bacterium]
MHWLQLVYSNDQYRYSSQPVVDAGNGAYYFIDGPQTSQGIPWYDGPTSDGGMSTADAADYMDYPGTPYLRPTFTQFYTYRAWFVEGTNDLVISYYGVSWGFYLQQ